MNSGKTFKPYIARHTKAAVTTANGLVASLGCLQIAKDANNRLDNILAELDEENIKGQVYQYPILSASALRLPTRCHSSNIFYQEY